MKVHVTVLVRCRIALVEDWPGQGSGSIEHGKDACGMHFDTFVFRMIADHRINFDFRCRKLSRMLCFDCTDRLRTSLVESVNISRKMLNREESRFVRLARRR